MRRLPTYYYLTHFQEFLGFIEGPCEHLLHEKHLCFLSQFKAATKHQQCLLVRCINRKNPAVKISSLVFEELPNIPQLIDEIAQLDWISYPGLNDTPDWLSSLTKEELLEVYEDCADTTTPKISKNAKRDALLNTCLGLPKESLLNSAYINRYIVRPVDDVIDYFLYLYFGNTKARLNQFSLRDLGVMRTRDDQAQEQSRFECKEEALSSFTLGKMLDDLRQNPPNTLEQINAKIKAVPQPMGLHAQAAHQRVVLELATLLLAQSPEQAVTLLATIESEKAQEKWCREAYKLGQLDAVKAKLESIIDAPLSDKILSFAEDFLARKYQQKRTSILTDMLRDAHQHIQVDESYKGSVERGVVAHYSNQGVTAVRTENKLWRSLFGLVFWQELFEIPGLGLATSFDHMPNCLKQNNFFDVAGEQIEAKLNSFNDNATLMTLLTKNALAYHGKGQGIFNWRSDLLESLQLFVASAPINGIKQQLRRMSQDWKGCHDGFPDIMVIENERLRFEEIKGEGDSLRRNQLLCIQKLREFGFEVRITTVDFMLDPDQPYVVVDIETTGSRANNHRITEIGMVKMVRGKIVDRWQSLLNPQRQIPPNITGLTGISEDMVRGAPLFSEVADEVDDFTDGCIFVAHNVNFDYGFIKEEFAKLGRFYRRPKLCTVVQMRKYYKGLPSYSLANLTKHFDIDMERHHRAMSDAVAASELLKLINEKRFSTS